MPANAGQSELDALAQARALGLAAFLFATVVRAAPAEEAGTRSCVPIS